MGKVATLQDNIKKNNTDIESYSYFAFGVNTKNAALSQYDLLRGGYGRVFVLQMPKFVEYLLPGETRKFKHLLEFGNVGIDGIQGYSVDFGSVTGSYTGQSIEIPMNVKEDTTGITMKLYETSGSLLRTYLDFWLSGVGDPLTGLSHYHGARKFDKSLIASQANQTMEVIYVATDQTGEELEYAALLTNMFPRNSDHSHFNYEAGSHDIVNTSIEFTANKYLSPQVNEIGKALLDKFKTLTNHMDLQSGYSKEQIAGMADLNIKDWITKN